MKFSDEELAAVIKEVYEKAGAKPNIVCTPFGNWRLRPWGYEQFAWEDEEDIESEDEHNKSASDGRSTET